MMWSAAYEPGTRFTAKGTTMHENRDIDVGHGPNTPNKALGLVLGVVGGLVGGAIGVVLFGWILRQGFYALLLPGAATGLGAWALARRRTLALGIVCGVIGLALGLFAEWHYRPFVADASLAYFITHLHELTAVTLLMMVGGGFLGFWFGKGRR